MVEQPQAIAHYLVDRELGRGAMGVVYLATDTKLGRPVAIKSLPVDLAADAARRERFEGEARTLASINHPNIGSIFGLEQQDGSTFLVLEFVEGPTLTDRLMGGPVELGEGLDICRQVALGIDAAHQRGVIHRDLKPDNIKIRPDGVVKVLDFGIALGGEVMGQSSPSAATIMAPAAPMSTRTGFIIGTPGYMSPEQARGKPVNASTDLWALGCVLYECLTGRAAFGGESLADALASTLMSEPDLGLLPPKTPARVLDLLRQALAKDFKKRTMTVGAAAEELARAKAEMAGGPARITVSLTDDGDWPTTGGNLPAGLGLDGGAGREAEVQQAVRLRGSSRLVTVVGPDGSGRGRVVLAAGAGAKESSAAGVWWVRLPATSAADAPALVTGFEVGARSGASTPAEAVARRIAARHVTLILDGCQHAPTACATLVHDLLYACPNLRVLAASRSALGIEGEATVVLGSLLQTMPLDAVVAVMFERARAVLPGYDAGPDGAVQGATIVRRLRGWPLAMDIAAGMAVNMPLSMVAEQLEERGRAAGLADPETATPEQAHRLVVQWVLEMLPPAELALVLQASAFAGPFGVRALAAAGGAKDSLPRAESDDATGGPLTARESRLLGLLPKVSARSLVQMDGDASDALGMRLIVPEPVRIVARERLSETPAAAAAVAAGRRAYYLAAAEQAAGRWAGPGGGAWTARMEADYAEMAAMVEAGDEAADALRARLAEFRAVRGL